MQNIERITMHLYKLSPSKLAWLYKDCPRCFWLDMNGIHKRPEAPFPRIFNAMDRRQRERLHGAKLPTGETFDTTERRVTSVPVVSADGEYSIMINGKLDYLLWHPSDGMATLGDFKTAAPKEEDIQRYQRQLNSYSFGLENPIKGDRICISGNRLFYSTPKTYDINETFDWFTLGGPVSFVDIPYDPDWFRGLLLEVMDFLAAPEPDMEIAAKSCSYCSWEAMICAEIRNPIHVERIEAHA